MRCHLVGQSGGLDGAQGLVINTDGAGVVNDLFELFNHQRFDASYAQGVGNGQPDRACTDDHDVGIKVRRGGLGRGVGVHGCSFGVIATGGEK